MTLNNKFEKVKAWYESKTVLGGVIAILSNVPKLLELFSDVTLTNLTGASTEIVAVIGGVLGGLYAIYGRVVASTKIKSLFK